MPRIASLLSILFAVAPGASAAGAADEAAIRKIIVEVKGPAGRALPQQPAAPSGK